MPKNNKGFNTKITWCNTGNGYCIHNNICNNINQQLKPCNRYRIFYRNLINSALKVFTTKGAIFLALEINIEKYDKQIVQQWKTWDWKTCRKNFIL